MHKQINSLQNQTIKYLLQLQEKSRTRRKEGVFLIEGAREISLSIKGNYEILQLFFSAEFFSEDKINRFFNLKNPVDIIEISQEIYQKIAYRGSTEGILAVAKTKNHSVDQLFFKTENPLILVAEAPEKPGNIGALLRTADAANLDAVIIANPKTDLYNPNIIRSSVGCVFTTPIATGTTTEIIDFLKSKKVNIYAAALQASKPYHEIDFTSASAIVIGTEATGLSEEWRKNSTQNIIIPMEGEIDSMNLSVAAGILVFEAKRQRIL
ncbi:MAG TPA: RNA methyltransferase [Salinimicrobium sp.]|nr:RNA methyltransferase [Salinimicrobium sp.]